ncbi:MAG: ECF transporter S component [Erysipelotrichia bacterium]|nr:ECF transporter S component [Erysipelotrichia bacterium]
MSIKKVNQTRKNILTAIFVALCVVLPLAFHLIPNAGTVFLPMHIPILLCGMLCGWQYGAVCGLLGPFLSCLLTSMPAIAYLPVMMIECCMYGLISGVMLRYLHTGKTYLNLYLTLIVAMICGRVASGIVKYVLFSGGLTLNGWIVSGFVTCFPGILIQLALIPSIVYFLNKSGIVK